MTYEQKAHRFENAFNATINSECSKEAAKVKLAEIMARFENGRGFAYRVHEIEAPVLNGQAAAYRELIAR